MEDQAARSPMFTVIMPVYNHEKYVDEAIQSVRDQVFRDWELIVVNDGSVDRSGEIVDRHAGAEEEPHPFYFLQRNRFRRGQRQVSEGMSQ